MRISTIVHSCLLLALNHVGPISAFAPSMNNSPSTFGSRTAAAAAAATRPVSLSRMQASRAGGSYDFALLFDCDGVILETEEFHRLAYNAAFKAAGLNIDGVPVEWSVEYYDVLQNTVGGGKPKMFYHFRETMGGRFPQAGRNPAPATPEEQQRMIDALQEYKTQLYKEMVEEEAVCRPGVLELMDAALADPTIAVGVCSASTKEAAQRTLSVTLGQGRLDKLDVCILGDDVSEKKPSPMIYDVARERIGLPKERCVVIEDSMVGLRAAKAAGMKCLITYTSSTATCDFYGEGADNAVPDLVTGGITLNGIFDPLREQGFSDSFVVSTPETSSSSDAPSSIKPLFF